MLNVQQYLQAKSLEDLTNEFAIKVAEHPTLPLVILNYNQIESPKTATIVRECRALVLDRRDWSVAAKSFNRFFNWGEVQEEQSQFDFSDFVVQSKEDGSLCVIYHFDGEWHANTRGSFAIDNMEFQNFTWRDAFCKALGINSLKDLDGKLDKDLTYICEFCSPWNKIVRKYDQPQMYLLTVFNGMIEYWPENVDEVAKAAGVFKRPTRYNFCNIDEIQAFLQEQASADATFEGVVICDKQGNRWKIKNLSYVSLHHLRGEGDNLYNPKHLLQFVLSGEDDELMSYFPEAKARFYEVKSKVLEAYCDLIETWGDHHDIVEQKDFALTIKDNPFSSVLFDVRKKHGRNQLSLHVKQAFRENQQLILKKLFKNELVNTTIV